MLSFEVQDCICLSEAREHKTAYHIVILLYPYFVWTSSHQYCQHHYQGEAAPEYGPIQMTGSCVACDEEP